MDKEQQENTSSSSSSSLSSSGRDDKSKGSAQSGKKSQGSDSNPSERSAGSPSRKSRKPKKPGVPNKKKGGVGFGAMPRAPHPPKRQKPRPVAAATREGRNTKKLITQELQIKHLNNLIVELQSENDSVKLENRTLKVIQARMQHKTKEDKTVDELTAQHTQDTHVLQEQLKRLKKQLRKSEQVMKSKDERLSKQYSDLRKNEESLAHMRSLLAQKGLESRDELLREIDKHKKVAQIAEERAAKVERNAELIDNMHQKILLGEKRKTAEATEKVIYLLELVQDLNRRLMIEETVQRNLDIYTKEKTEEKDANADDQKKTA